MEEFPFTFNLAYKIEEYIVKPPPNFLQLKELASKKYDITIEEMSYTNDNDEELIIKNDQDYADLIEYASDKNLNEVDIFINKEKEKNEEEEEEKEELEENYNHTKGNNSNNVGEEIGMDCDYDYYGDTRNRKGKTEDGYTKHNKGFKEKKRIGYIIEKKQMQREETLKNQKNRKKKKY